MSSLWTPGGERPVRRPESAPVQTDRADPVDLSDLADLADHGPQPSSEELEEMQTELREMQEELASVPAAAVIANHVIGLFQLAAIHLQTAPPNLADAQLAIDAMAAVTDDCRGRLGPDEPTLHDALAQIRLAFVQVSGSLGSR